MNEIEAICQKICTNPEIANDDGNMLNGYIITDDGCYWSEEEGGRFSGGALYEKTFTTRDDAKKYMKDKNIYGKVTRHSDHWTCRMPLKTLAIMNIKI